MQNMKLLFGFISTDSYLTCFIQVPLVLFKREKEVCRNLEFEGKWIAEQPSDDDIMGHWDKIVISTKSFPDKYWDKFVKKKVRRTCDTTRASELSNYSSAVLILNKKIPKLIFDMY